MKFDFVKPLIIRKDSIDEYSWKVIAALFSAPTNINEIKISDTGVEFYEEDEVRGV